MSAAPPARLLEWDSEHWGATIARVRDGDFTAPFAAGLEEWADENRVQLLSYLCDAADGASLLRAQDQGFVVVDVRLELSIDLRAAVAVHPARDDDGVAVRPATEADLPVLRAIAAAVHTNTRFAVDLRLQPRAGALYERWIERDLRAAGLAVAATSGHDVTGYLTASVDAGAGSISLVGVDAAARGRGAGRVLVRAALEWFRTEDCTTASVVTSASSVAAQRLYQAFGFRTAAAGLWLHRWRDERAACE